MVQNNTWVVGLADRYYSRKTISNQSKNHELVTGLEFDPTDVGAPHGHSMSQKRSIDVLSGPIKQMLI